MQAKRNRWSTVKVLKNGRVVGYLTHKGEENGLDIYYNNLGYEIVAL